MCQNELEKARTRKAAPESCFINCMKTFKSLPTDPPDHETFPARSFHLFQLAEQQGPKIPSCFLFKTTANFWTEQTTPLTTATGRGNSDAPCLVRRETITAVGRAWEGERHQTNCGVSYLELQRMFPSFMKQQVGFLGCSETDAELRFSAGP